MTQPHVLANLNLAKKYFDSLPSDDVSRRYFSGEKFSSGWASTIKLFFSVGWTLGELNRFYQYQPVVKRTYELYKEKNQKTRNGALVFSVFSIFLVHQSAKNNIILPFFKKFGIFNTHRLFMQYLALIFLPSLFAKGHTNYFFLRQTQKLWGVHSERLNAGILSDPESSQYPIDKLPASQVHSYITPYVHPYDLPKKRANEVDIMVAPDYENIEEWEKVPLTGPEDDEEEGEDGQEGGEGGQEGGEGGDDDEE